MGSARERALPESPMDEGVKIRFENRRQAGRLLTAFLHNYCDRPATVVLGIPRGGVVVAGEIARALRLPLDVVISRKLDSPVGPEVAVGAVAEGGEPYLDDERIEFTGTPSAHIAKAVDRERHEIARRQRLFREGRDLALPARGTVIVVDDGVLSGSTMFAALQAIRRFHPARTVVAVPVVPQDTLAMLRSMVDEVVVIETMDVLTPLPAFYDDFREVEDAEVCSIVEGAL